VCDWQAGLKNCHYAAYSEYTKQQQHQKMRRRAAKEEAALESLHFAQWAMTNVFKGLRVLVLYENQLSADLDGQEYQGCVMSVGPYWPPSMLIKFELLLQPGDEGDEYCMHSLEFKSFKEFAQLVEIIQ
jgi:hypothetical protein